MEFTEEFLENAHKHCFNNKEEINKSDTCGCFYCREIFAPNEIKEWIVSEKYPKETTAQCPYCMIDAVIGNASGINLSNDFLIAMYEKYFNTTGLGEKIEDIIWVTYKDDDGSVKSAPHYVFDQIAQKKGWVKQTDEDCSINTELMKFSGKNVKVTTIDDKVFIGYCECVTSSYDNDNNIPSVSIKVNEFVYELYLNEIKSISEYDE